MARIKGKDIYLTDDDQIYFGNNKEAAMWFEDGELQVDHTISGIAPIATDHLATKGYVDDNIINDHGELIGLADDDHPQYVLTDGSRGFTSTVSGVSPTEDYHLTNREYVIGIFDGSILPPAASGIENYSLIQFKYTEHLPVSSTNSTTYQDKLRLTVSGVPEGNYRIAWNFEWRNSKSNETTYVRIQIDDSEEVFYFEGSPYVNIEYWHVNSSFLYYNSLSSGTHYIDIDYKSSSIGATAEVRNARLEFWRIQ